MRLAMWSGPRNLSTAMMYSFAQRSDFAVVDEPFYGPYLRLRPKNHPMRDAILQDRWADGDVVEAGLRGGIPDGKAHVYHKHMCQHMIEGIPRGFMADCVNVFLIRHPARVIESFAKEFPDVTSEDIGFDAQLELFRHVEGLGQKPIVIDSHDIRQDPETMLKALCQVIGLAWDPNMLVWPPGPKPYDGVWAPVWYTALHKTRGFAGPEGPLPQLSDRHADLAKKAETPYRILKSKALVLT